MTVFLHVCTTCRMGQPIPDEDIRPGARLLTALEEAGAPDGVRIVPVECLSACDHGCNVALTGPGRWSYVYRGMNPDTHVADNNATYRTIFLIVNSGCRITWKYIHTQVFGLGG